MAKTTRPVPRQWPISVAGFKQLSPKARQDFLPGWKPIRFDWVKEKLQGHIYRHPDGRAEVLELDQFVQMQVLQGGQLGLVRDLPAYCARPLRQRTLVQGVVWSCDDWAALALGDAVQEVWWVAK
jgi:hypothetical protein